MWNFGDVVVLRYGTSASGFTGGIPLFVIEHTTEQLVAYLAEGTETAAPVLADGRGLRDVPLEERWTHPRSSVSRPWLHTDLVMIFPHGRRHSLWVFHESSRHVGWYVNLEEPHVFGERTISTRDDILDVWIPAETKEPVWKDEDEFAMATRVGRLSSVQAAAIRKEGERVIREQPWPTGWENWRPPAGWRRPQLPPDWDAQA